MVLHATSMAASERSVANAASRREALPDRRRGRASEVTPPVFQECVSDAKNSGCGGERYN
jgi:hypothetical protein